MSKSSKEELAVPRTCEFCHRNYNNGAGRSIYEPKTGSYIELLAHATGANGICLLGFVKKYASGEGCARFLPKRQKMRGRTSS